MYEIIQGRIPQSERTEINEKILESIKNGSDSFSREMIYNSYTGLGGLHNLRQSDFENYHKYSQAKKEFEIGQFFTPHVICRQMVELTEPDDSDSVLDMCCGMGNFFNHLPNPDNAYGFDIDENAVTVAKYLYPDAHIEKCDIMQYEPERKFDIVIGNPPFNLDFGGVLSQFFYCSQAFKALNPAGLLVMIVPLSFLDSDFWDRRQVSAINRDFSFIGQTKLPSDAFVQAGVENFETKIMVFSRLSESIEKKPCLPDEFLTYEELKERITAFKQQRSSIKQKLNREVCRINNQETLEFEYKIKKCLFDIPSTRFGSCRR